MKITLKSGEIFEGTVQDFFVFYRNYNNKKLIDILYTNYKRRSKTGSAVAIHKTRDGLIIFTATPDQQISIDSAMEIDGDFFNININDFNCDNKIERCIMSYNNLSFDVVIDKNQTTNENVFITEINLVDNSIPSDVSKILLLAESLAKPLISTTLKAISIFINGHSSELSLKNYGYTRFE